MPEYALLSGAPSQNANPTPQEKRSVHRAGEGFIPYCASRCHEVPWRATMSRSKPTLEGVQAGLLVSAHASRYRALSDKKW